MWRGVQFVLVQIIETLVAEHVVEDIIIYLMIICYLVNHAILLIMMELIALKAIYSYRLIIGSLITALSTITSSICPNQLCCQMEGNCNYMDENSLFCALNRDFESMLCAKCMEGFSESINSNQCVKCDELFYFAALLYPIALSILIFCVKTMSSRDPIDVNHKTSGPQNTPTTPGTKRQELTGIKRSLESILSGGYFMVMMKTIVLKNILYYEQAVSQTLSGAGISVPVLISSVAEIFNLSVSGFNTNARNPQCFMDGLNAKQKLLFNLSVPLIILISIAILYLTSIIFYHGSLKCLERKINFGRLFIGIFLVIIGNILSVLFQLLNCQTIGDNNVHFYFGYEDCYGFTWMVSLVSLVIISLLFSFTFLKISRMNAAERQKPNAFSDIVDKYKPQFYFWEFVLYTRRIVIAMFSVSVTGIVSKLMFIAILFVFVYVQQEYEPFITHEGNKMEIILLCCLIFVVVAQMASSYASQHSSLIIGIISCLIVFPFCLTIYFVVRFINKRISKFHDEADQLAVHLGTDAQDKKDTDAKQLDVHLGLAVEIEMEGNEDRTDAMGTVPELDLEAVSLDESRSSLSLSSIP
eukprot:205307_1